MRASKLIEELEKLIDENGDCYVTYKSESYLNDMENVEEIKMIPYEETKYFCIF